MTGKISLKKLVGKYKLKPAHILVYAAIFKSTQANGFYGHGYDKLAKKVNLSRGLVFNIVNDLEELKLVERSGHNGKKIKIRGLEA